MQFRARTIVIIQHNTLEILQRLWMNPKGSPRTGEMGCHLSESCSNQALWLTVTVCQQRNISPQLSQLLIQSLKCKAKFSVVKTLYCQRIPFWRTQAIREGAIQSLEHKRRRDAKENYNSIEIEGKTLCLQQDYKHAPNRCIEASFTKFQKWSVVWGCISTNVSVWVFKLPEARNMQLFLKNLASGSVSNETKAICPTLKTLHATDISGGTSALFISPQFYKCSQNAAQADMPVFPSLGM